MKQYCRYCAHAYLQGDEMIWCQQKDEIRTGREITRLGSNTGQRIRKRTPSAKTNYHFSRRTDNAAA